MATCYFPLLAAQRVDPTSNPPTASTVTSSATATTNTPKPTLTRLAFDQATDKHTMFTFRLPDNYASGGTLTIKWGAAVSSGNVVWLAGAAVATDASTDITAGTFLAADSSGAVAVPASVGLVKETSIALTMTGAVAAKHITVFVGRDADAGTDTAAGDAYVWDVQFSYSSS